MSVADVILVIVAVGAMVGCVLLVLAEIADR